MNIDEFKQLDKLLQEIEVYGGYCRHSGEQEMLGNFGTSRLHTEWATEVYQRIVKQVEELRGYERLAKPGLK